ncbi:MAG: ate [Hyphomonadaceae bacterium]|nr:MAG: ate [Hyphomonadaceae bacterium]
MSNSEFGNFAPVAVDPQIRFYITDAQPCPYLPDRLERKIFTNRDELNSDAIIGQLTEAGFRRSQNVFYRPACDMCSKCVSVRIPVQDFEVKKQWRRILRKNHHLQRFVNSPDANEERFALLSSYLEARHKDGAMYGIDADSFIAMIEDGTNNTKLVDYRLREDCFMGSKNELVACCLIDELIDGTSMVYSFFNPNLPEYSLGSFIILDQIERLKAIGLSYLYLGYWIENSATMHYKSRFAPIEGLGRNGWQSLTA